MQWFLLRCHNAFKTLDIVVLVLFCVLDCDTGEGADGVLVLIVVYCLWYLLIHSLAVVLDWMNWFNLDGHKHNRCYLFYLQRI